MEYKNLGTKVDKSKIAFKTKTTKYPRDSMLNTIEEKPTLKSNEYEPRYLKILGVGSEVTRIGSEVIKYFKRLIN